jgi:hypothetical protein
MMRIGRLAPADQTWLGSYKPQMGFVTKTFGLCNGQNALNDPSREQIWCGRDDRGID